MDSVVNIALVFGESTAGDTTYSEPDTAMTTIPSMPLLTIEKTASLPGVTLGDNGLLTDGGDSILYTYVVTNTGNVTVTSIMINDPGPTFNGMAAIGTFDTILCDSINLAPGESTECSALYTLSQDDVNNAAGAPNLIVNGATASGFDPDSMIVESNPDTAYTTIPSGPSLVIEKSVDSISIINGTLVNAVDADDSIYYSFVITNTGNVTLTSVMVVDAGPTFGGIQGENGALSVMCDTMILNPGESATCSAVYALTQMDVDNGADIANGVINSAITYQV